MVHSCTWILGKGNHWDKADATKLSKNIRIFHTKKTEILTFLYVFFSSRDKTLSLLPKELYHI